MNRGLSGGATPGWRPLPECSICAEPVRRAVYEANGGTCSDCRGLLPDLAPRQGDQGELVDLGQWQALVAHRGAEERARQAERARRRRER